MSSQIDPTVIADDEPVDKADVRAQLQIAKNEITALQNQVSYPRLVAYSDQSFDNL